MHWSARVMLASVLVVMLSTLVGAGLGVFGALTPANPPLPTAVATGGAGSGIRERPEFLTERPLTIKVHRSDVWALRSYVIQDARNAGGWVMPENRDGRRQLPHEVRLAVPSSYVPRLIGLSDAESYTDYRNWTERATDHAFRAEAADTEVLVSMDQYAFAREWMAVAVAITSMVGVLGICSLVGGLLAWEGTDQWMNGRT